MFGLEDAELSLLWQWELFNFSFLSYWYNSFYITAVKQIGSCQKPCAPHRAKWKRKPTAATASAATVASAVTAVTASTSVLGQTVYLWCG